MKRLLVVLVLLAASGAWAQSDAKLSLTTGQTKCKAIADGASAAVATVSGTWSGTGTFRGTVDPLTLTVASSTLFDTWGQAVSTRLASYTFTANDTFVIPTAGFSRVCVAYVGTGTMVVQIRLGPVSPVVSLDPVQHMTTGTLGAAGTAVTSTLPGWLWATAKVDIGAGCTRTVVWEETIDGATWMASAYGQTGSTVAASVTNPAAATWEVPLRGNSFQFRARVSAGASGTCTASVYGGRPYVPGDPVVAVGYDFTTANNTSITTGTLDTSGWTSIGYDLIASGGTASFTVQEVDDGGNALASVVTSTGTCSGGWGVGVTLGCTAGTAAATASLPLPRQVKLSGGAIVGQTNRIRALFYR